ncbi:glycosyltransferase family 2 protein [Shouchella clausii]|uniref:Glycosyltransferase 2-like domain-containing protein n=1 Tax=Shouchella clausii TaxID=79880 RepID=A0A268RYF1_SHOCL|nr:glycosyltransferase family A protein [Shouchella clausii]PAD43191.1 hypothetical protein CHH54_08045 [Bacillus sp. 7520-S]AST96625.1 hypothetical protein BC8716_11955 [Shouchella clausii]MBU8596621.1 glycosyltransferase family 2 protein [Shouchella clausii]MEB5471225.1 glycosyltransferase family A protein [Shouchella clausii]MEB5478681.1 glycosyltransferase family A protein [Shouchella clausii]
MITFVVPTLGERCNEFKRLLVSLDKQTDKRFELIVVSQGNYDQVEQWLSAFQLRSTHIQLGEKGLSRARNAAWPALKGDIVSFSDDDCWYPPDAVERVHSAFAQEGADAYCFQIYDPIQQSPYKHYNTSPGTVRGRRVWKKSSIELFFRQSAIESLRFNEAFGLGGTYPSGEENLFLRQFLVAGHTLMYIPETIVFHEKPSQASRLQEAQLVSKGPLFKTMYNGPFGFVLLTALFAKKYKHLKHPTASYAKAVRALLNYKPKEARP